MAIRVRTLSRISPSLRVTITRNVPVPTPTELAMSQPVFRIRYFMSGATRVNAVRCNNRSRPTASCGCSQGGELIQPPLRSSDRQEQASQRFPADTSEIRRARGCIPCANAIGRFSHWPTLKTVYLRIIGSGALKSYRPRPFSRNNALEKSARFILGCCSARCPCVCHPHQQAYHRGENMPCFGAHSRL